MRAARTQLSCAFYPGSRLWTFLWVKFSENKNFALHGASFCFKKLITSFGCDPPPHACNMHVRFIMNIVYPIKFIALSLSLCLNPPARHTEFRF